MTHLKKQVFQVVIGIILVTLVNFNLQARIKINDSESGFMLTGENSANALKYTIIKGAGFFLGSHSDYLEFLSQIEWSDVSKTE
jgi:hypothetical protein